ncbi:peptidylprolyl isomerase [Algibacter pectinivorans]|nr:peptidylprolyl isomerase [Algibacter pectinivorans]
MKKIFMFITIICFHYAKAQNDINLTDILENVESQSQIDSLKFLYPNLSIKKHSLSTGDKNINKKVFLLEEKEINADSIDAIKLLSQKDIKEFKVKYIFINGKNLNEKEIKKIQKKAYKELKKGKTFSEVANKYSMDPGSKDGDLGWFPEGRMIERFENAIREHKKDEIFQVSDQSRKWHFIILKNHDEREAKIYEYITITKS